MQRRILDALDIHDTDGFGLMRKRLIAWTILTSALVAVTVWTVLGPPAPPSSPHLPSRTASVR
ncbi:hypothetical protein [Bradyrhizobium sp. 141]|uniref:hypothetical protein n=1 Tax=Bradyrhizobium sp. 141 TaxID=2782617 RepID=UPI001FF99EBC|nr:hypothetical protein [Bradyrhizobium sp. 141]MCK1723286.1 hypothetical protein [Bradyrhizobium sp. 141]